MGSMSNNLAIIERQLTPLTPMFEQLLRPTGVPAQRIIRTVLISCERQPKLLECTPQSIIQAATTGAVLGLEADGVSGQGFLVPFAGKAQWITGYKGMATLGARAGLTIDGTVVREGDDFTYGLGTLPFVSHMPLLGGEGTRRIIGAWAAATAPGRAPIVVVMSIDEIEEIKRRAPSSRKSDSPWNQPGIPYAAMAGKTARRRLARSTPLSSFVLAARIDEAHEEQGKHAFLHPENGVIIEGVASPLAESQPGPVTLETSRIEPRKFWLMKRNGKVACTSIEDWRSKMELSLNKATPEQAKAGLDLNAEIMDELRDEFPEHVNAVGKAFEKRIRG
jgi:recombination protein RecT